jgi:hypothetical protein
VCFVFFWLGVCVLYFSVWVCVFWIFRAHITNWAKIGFC